MIPGYAGEPGRWVGSLAGKVLHGASCPVVTVKTPDVDPLPVSDKFEESRSDRSPPTVLSVNGLTVRSHGTHC